MKAKRKTMHLFASPQIFRNAQILRDNQTPAEILLWNYLKDRNFEGLKFRRQHPLKSYVCDFYCHELKLIIEIDGKYHNTKHQSFSDSERESSLENDRNKIIRFTNEEILCRVENVLETLREEVNTLKLLKNKGWIKR